MKIKELENSYYLVSGHLDEDYFERVTGDPDQVDFIEETCEVCGDCDRVQGEFSNYEDGLKLIKAQGYNPEYREEMEKRLRSLK